MAAPSPRPVLRFADGGWAEAVGNHPALDLVNTVAWRRDPDRTVDRLPDGAALVTWAVFVGLLDQAQAAAFEAELDRDPEAGHRLVTQVRRTRERLHRVLQPMAAGAEPAAADVAELHRELL